MDPKIIVYITFGLALLGLTWLPNLKGAKYINVPLLYFLLAAFLSSQSLGLPVIDPIHNKLHTVVTEYLTELIVIISLAGAGLAIDRTFRFRSWEIAWRLLCIAMPLSIAAAALLGHWIFGLPVADAVLLGACLAPTDPVMAHSVQVGPPNQGKEDPTRFGLTTEAGLNDGLAFPFVYLALGFASHDGAVGTWLVNWVAYDFIYRVAMGAAVGVGVGWLLGHYAFQTSNESVNEETQEGLFIAAAIFLAYGLAEAMHGYGFLAVFSAAVSARQNFSKSHDYHQKPYQFATQLERILAGLLLLALGDFVVSSDLTVLTWRNFLFAGLFMLVCRTLSGVISLVGVELPRLERWAIAFLGIRGFGSFYYLAYAQNNGTFDNIELVWSIVTLTVIVSLLIHGNTATIAMEWIDHNRHQRRQRRQQARASALKKPSS